MTPRRRRWVQYGRQVAHYIRPKGWGVLSVLSTVGGVSTIALVSGLLSRSAIAAVVVGAVTLLLLVVFGGYRTWDETDQERMAAEEDRDRVAEARDRVAEELAAERQRMQRQSELHDALGNFLLEAMPIRNGLERHLRFIETQAAEDMVPTVDEPEDVVAAAKDWQRRVVGYLESGISRATAITFADLHDQPVHPQHRTNPYLLWRDAMAVFMPRLVNLIDRYAPDRSPAP